MKVVLFPWIARADEVWFLLQKIRELISVLDQRKDESIERTFKGVAKFFKEAFSELVPGGHGSLVMMTKRRVSHYDFFPSQGTLYFFQSLVRFHSLFIL
jgi:hypothetical protein